MFLYDYKGYSIHIPTSGGKAGKGHQKTSNFQVRSASGSLMVKQFRFTVDSAQSRQTAMHKARLWIDANPYTL